MAHVWFHCNGIGKKLGTTNVETPYYKNGVAIVAWAPPHGRSEKENLKTDAKIEKYRQKILDEISKATGGKQYGDPSRVEIEADPPT